MIKLRDRDTTFFDNDPLVSVSCINYNHILTIRNTLEYFLDQKTTFPVEILINDDASTDGTSDIIMEYADKYPHIFKPIIQKENNYSKGLRGLHKNFNFWRAKGKFIAVCDGDDYWIDEKKLQTQADFLIKNSDFSLTSHDSFLKVYARKKNINLFLSIIRMNFLRSSLKYNLLMYKDIMFFNSFFWNRLLANSSGIRYPTADFKLTFETFYKKIYIPASSIMGRAEILKSIPDDLSVCITGHHIHVLWPACFGKLHHTREIMSLKNDQPTSLTVTREHLKNSNRYIKLKGWSSLYSNFFPYINQEQKNILKQIINEIDIQIKNLE